jgi:hypothetical protein
MLSEDGQLTETSKGNKYLQIESHWTRMDTLKTNTQFDGSGRVV